MVAHQPLSAGKDRVRDITIEPHVGGQVFETWDDATTVAWGEILSWDPPAGFTMSWTYSPQPTEVEFRFQSLGPNLTRVGAEHRGWDALTETELGEDCALPGGYRSGAYNHGWILVLERFTTAISATVPHTDLEEPR